LGGEEVEVVLVSINTGGNEMIGKKWIVALVVVLGLVATARGTA